VLESYLSACLSGVGVVAPEVEQDRSEGAICMERI